jgi:hypothetical protein
VVTPAANDLLTDEMLRPLSTPPVVRMDNRRLADRHALVWVLADWMRFGGHWDRGANVAAFFAGKTVPGGALLSTQMMDDAVFRPVLARAVECTDGRCGCGPEGSCSSCLRWYENRWAHPYLKREAVNAWLRKMEREIRQRAWT